MQVELRKVLPSHLESVRTLTVQKIGDVFHLIEEGGSDGKVLTVGSRAHVIAQLEEHTRGLMRRGWRVTGGDAAYRRVHPGFFQVKLSPKVREALEQAGLGDVGATPAVSKQQPLPVRREASSRMEAIRPGED